MQAFWGVVIRFMAVVWPGVKIYCSQMRRRVGFDGVNFDAGVTAQTSE
jgi:hypothetical protein